MKAVARLVYTYFAATSLMRGLSVAGLVLAVAGMTSYLFSPPLTLGTGVRHDAIWIQTVLLVAPWLGLITLFLATTHLPVVVERLAFGRLILILPGARIRLLASVALTAAFIAVLTGLGGVVAFLYFPQPFRPEHIFSRVFTVVFADISVMYVALWLVGKTRGVWLLLGSLLVGFGVLAPLNLIGRPSGVPGLVWVGVAGWAIFATLLLGGARLRHSLIGTISRARSVLRPRARYESGGELTWLLGTSRPWIVAVGQAVPLVAIAWLNDPVVWLFFLTLFSAISGAITSLAPGRSRTLWLRYGWTRDEIFQRVETAYWRYNAYALGVLLVLLVAIGSYREYSTQLLALGASLLVLSSVVSAYLGLTMTRGLRWPEAIAGIATTLLLLFAAVLATRPNPDLGLLVQLGLVALAVVYRVIARARWHSLDWMVCRPPPAARPAG